ncbi:Vegetative incompatibility protein HET-E-1 [Cladobotryum mycophilum]|uniref:Mitochondrial division protein 1 n=1 Tax=Cladobotryum mycophilum TaxID=491253 RepID=A0ABR0SCR5_9HYPO
MGEWTGKPPATLAIEHTRGFAGTALRCLLGPAAVSHGLDEPRLHLRYRFVRPPVLKRCEQAAPLLLPQERRDQGRTKAPQAPSVASHVAHLDFHAIGAYCWVIDALHPQLLSPCKASMSRLGIKSICSFTIIPTLAIPTISPTVSTPNTEEMKKGLKKLKNMFSRESATAPSSIAELRITPSNLSVNHAGTVPSSGEIQQATATASQAVSNVDTVEALVQSSVLCIIGSLSGVDVGPEDCQLETQSTEQQNPPTPELSTSQRLWNAAYDSLEGDEETSELVKNYVKTLARVLKAGNGPDASVSEGDVSNELGDLTKRQEFMKKAMDEGRKKFATSSKIMQMAGDVSQFILSAKAMIDVAIQNVPQAALPWAGVCLGLQILLNPGKATKANLAGIAHITSRMDWYCALTEHLLNKEHITVGNESFTVVIEVLEKAILALYKALVLHQMKSICCYYRNQGVVFLRGLANLDDWDSALECVKDAEAALETMSTQHHREYEKSSLHQLVDSGREMETLLGDMHLDLRDLIDQQKKRDMDDKDIKCLQDLFVLDPQYDMESIEKKKDELCDNAFNWILSTEQFAALTDWDNDESTFPLCRLLWIKGPAGTGKTMLLIGIIRKLTQHSAALSPKVSHFFCQGTDNKRNSVTAILRSLLWLLIVQQPHLISYLHAKYKYSGPSLFTDSNTPLALLDVFKSMLQDPRLSRVYLIVDALDECGQGLEDLIKLIATSLSICDKVRWLVASRLEVELNNSLSSEIAGSLLELDAQSLEGPVNTYIDYKLSILRKRRGFTDDIVNQVSCEIRQRAANTFLWVALVFKKLEKINAWDAIKTIEKIPLDVLVATSLAYRPLSLPELSVLAGLSTDVDVKIIVEECGSFLTISGETVYLIHQSAKDYLSANHGTKLQQGGVAQGHDYIYRRSIEGLSKVLRKNIYNLSDFGPVSKDLRPPNPNPLASIQYSCIFWIDHLCDAHSTGPGPGIELNDALWSFLTGHFLHWVESLSLLHRLPDGPSLIRKVRERLRSCMNPQLVSFLNDAERFMLSNMSIIDQAPLQTYGSALVFSPTSSAVKQHQASEKLSFIKEIQGTRDYDMCIQMLEGHSDDVFDIVFSPDGKTLASSSRDKSIRLWDAITGIIQRSLEGHTKGITGVAFSPNGKTLASSSHDNTIRLWDSATGAHQQTLKHESNCMIFAFLLDGRTLASFEKPNIKLWDVVTGALQKTFQCNHGEKCYGWIFSSDGKMLALSEDKKKTLWDTATGALHHTIENDNCGPVDSGAFSLDGKMLASSKHYEIQLWDVATGVLQKTFEHDYKWRCELTFSLDGKMLASSDYREIQLWDTTTGALQKTLNHNSERYVDRGLNEVAFSPDGKKLASIERSTIRIWDITISGSPQTSKDTDYEVLNMVLSLDGKTLASKFRDCIWLWDTATGIHQHTIIGDFSSHMAKMAFSPDNETLATTSRGGSVSLWNVATGIHQRTLHAGKDVWAIAFSPDSKIIASLAISVQRWDVATGTHLPGLEHRPLSLHTNSMNITFSPDGNLLAIRDWHSVQILDGTTGAQQKRLPSFDGADLPNNAIAFSPNGDTLALINGNRLKIWDISTCTVKQTLKNDSYYWIQDIAFSIDGQLLNTNIGSINISSQSDTTNEASAHDLFFDGEWISGGGKHLLWIPKDYRGDRSVFVHGDTVMFGHSQGVTFLHFDSLCLY